MLGLDEMKDSVLAGVLAGHEGGPGRRRDWWQNRFQTIGDTGLHQSGQIRQATFCHPRPNEGPGGGVEPDHNDLRDLLHVASRLSVLRTPVKGRDEKGWQGKRILICTPSRSASHPGRIENRSPMCR